MKAIIIARVSTEEQKEAGNSLPAQSARMKKYCQNKGFKIVKEFSFDESAYKDKRNDFDSILDYVIKQKDNTAVCFDKVDRFSRNIFDKRVPVLYERALNDEIELHFISDGLVINSKLSAAEKFQFGISLGLAKYYSDAISDNVKRAIEQKLRKGEWPGKAPFGYINVELDNEKKDIVVDSFNSKIIQKTYEWYETQSYSMDLLREKLEKKFGITWSKGMVDAVLKNPFYYGEMKWKGKLYSHKYPPLITKGLFDRVQQIKAGFNKKRFKYAGLPFFYRGLIRCADCGCMITPEKAKDKYVYYHCTQYKGKHGAEWLREEELTEQLGEVFKNLQIPEEVLNKTVEALNSVHKDKIEFREDQHDKLNKEHEIYAKRLEKLYMDRLDGRITDNEYDKYYQSFRDKITEIDTNLSMLQDAEDNYYVTAKYLLELANRAYELFLSSEIEERRQLIKLVLQNLRLEHKKLLFKPQKPFDVLLKCADNKLWLPRVLR